MFLLHFFVNKEKFSRVRLNAVFLIDADQNATFSLLTYFRLVQFSYTEIGHIPDHFISFDDFMTLTRYDFAFSGYPMKKMNSTN